MINFYKNVKAFIVSAVRSQGNDLLGSAINIFFSQNEFLSEKTLKHNPCVFVQTIQMQPVKNDAAAALSVTAHEPCV